MDRPPAAIAVYTVGMAVFTAIMGNAFAAFPVMTAGIGLPLIVMKFGGNPAIMSRSACCRLLRHVDDADGGEFQPCSRGALGLEDRYAVIKAQIRPRSRFCWSIRCSCMPSSSASRGSARQTKLDLRTASRFATIALGHVVREYPNRLDHVLAGPPS